MVSRSLFTMLFAALFFTSPIDAQETPVLTLPALYELTRKNYPLIKQNDLITKSREYTVANAGKAYLPQITINGQASYQSTVTAIPINIPGMEIPQLSRDQYRLYAEINQPLYDGGMGRSQKQLAEASAVSEERKLEVELYALKDRIDQLYFGIFITNARITQISLVIKDLSAMLTKTEAAIKNGIALKSDAAQLKAEILQAEQRKTELSASKKAYLSMLGSFAGQKLDENTRLSLPEMPPAVSTNNRPELQLLDQQAAMLALHRETLTSRSRPRLNLFVQGGLGRPALNMLSNTFEPYYIGGLRLHWNLSGMYTITNDRQLNDLARKNIVLQKELFLFGTGLQELQQDTEIEKLESLLKSDDEIVELRTEIRKTAESKLENGVLTTSEYLREVNAEQQSRESRLIHQVQLLMAAYKKQNLLGGNSNSQ